MLFAAWHSPFMNTIWIRVNGAEAYCPVLQISDSSSARPSAESVDSGVASRKRSSTKRVVKQICNHGRRKEVSTVIRMVRLSTRLPSIRSGTRWCSSNSEVQRRNDEVEGRYQGLYIYKVGRTRLNTINFYSLGHIPISSTFLCRGRWWRLKRPMENLHL